MSNNPNRRYDVIVVGAGHNALVCAAYLAKAGQQVAVFERSDIVGGACVSKEIFPGFRFDLGAATHTLIHLTPIVKDLELEQYGLDYLVVDPLFFAPYPDNTYFTIWRSLDQTCESIAQISPIDAENYRRFCHIWTPFALIIGDLMMTNPSPIHMTGALANAAATRRGWYVLHLPQLRLSIRQFLDYYFQSEKVKALLACNAALVGVSLDHPGTAVYVVWQVLYHLYGITIPRGGSGMLSQALARYIEAHGGTVYTSTPVKQILVEQGKAIGVETVDGQQADANIIVSGTHIKTTAALLGAQLPPAMGKRIHALKTSNGLGVVLRIAATGFPEYRATTERLSHIAIQQLVPSMDYIESTWNAFNQGLNSQNPFLSVTTLSAVDPTTKPTISIWAQYYPYRFSDGRIWDSNTQTLIINQILDTFSAYAPNIRDLIVDMRLYTPLSLESELGLIGGDFQHIQTSPDQMFMFRPGLRFSSYKTPIKQLYLTGASTHPAGGITGMSGLNAARTILRSK